METEIYGAYPIVLCAGTIERPTNWYTWWLDRPGPCQALAARDGRVLWVASEDELSARTPDMVPATHEVHAEPPAACAVRQLVAALSGPIDRDASYLTTIDLLDDLSGNADEHGAGLGLDGSPCRAVFTQVRNALFDGQDWPAAVEGAGPAELRNAVLATMGSIALVSTILTSTAG